MKKILSMAMCLVAIITSLNVYAIDVLVDSSNLTMDVSPVIENGRTLVPVRAIFEELGATIEWNDSTRTATAIKDNDIIKITLDSNIAYINGKEVILDVPAKSINGRTLVPVRFVSESLGAEVYWLSNTQTVRIATKLYEVTRVVDGDTLVVNIDGVEEKVRLIGIDTPESVHPDSDKNTEAGVTASEYTKNLILNKYVELELDVQERDKYGRVLAYVYLDGVMVNKTLLKEGYAVVSTYPPNVKYVDDFITIANQNSSSNSGTSNNGNNATTGTFVGSLKSDKYHYPTCRHAKTIETYNEIWFQSISEATSSGYVACGVCKPK